jgi:hypothetical protein
MNWGSAVMRCRGVVVTARRSGEAASSRGGDVGLRCPLLLPFPLLLDSLSIPLLHVVRLWMEVWSRFFLHRRPSLVSAGLQLGGI